MEYSIKPIIVELMQEYFEYLSSKEIKLTEQERTLPTLKFILNK